MKPGYKFLNSILALGMFLIFLGVLMVLAFAGDSPDFAVWILPGAVFLAGLIDLYFYIAFSKVPFRLFLGLNLTFYGIFSMIFVYNILPFGIDKLWPVYMFLTGLSLSIAGRTTGKRFTLTYDFPGIILTVLGIVFLLFSFDVIKISLSRLAVFLWPVLFILAGAFLIVLFLYRKSLLDILPDDMSAELNDEPNFSDADNEEE